MLAQIKSRLRARPKRTLAQCRPRWRAAPWPRPRWRAAAVAGALLAGLGPLAVTAQPATAAAPNYSGDPTQFWNGVMLQAFHDSTGADGAPGVLSRKPRWSTRSSTTPRARTSTPGTPCRTSRT